MLGAVYYDGDSSEELAKEIWQENSDGQTTGEIYTGEYSGDGRTVAGDGELEDMSATVVTTTVKESENATITQQVESKDTYLIDGEEVSLGQAMEAIDSVEIQSEKTVTITATVENSEGWTELADTVTAAGKQLEETETMNVSVQLSGTTVAGEDLAKLAGESAELTIISNQGDTWKIDTATLEKKSVENQVYELGMSVEEVDISKTQIQGEKAYRLQFNGDVDFGATVGVYTSTENAYQHATLFQKQGTNYETIQTVMIDKQGNAWFDLSQADSKGEYYIGVNVEGVTSEEVVIPASLYEDYGIDTDEYILTDENGVQYEITGRTSSWGITGGRFAIYVAVAVGAVILIVGLVMVTINKSKQSKEKYARMAAEEGAAHEQGEENTAEDQDPDEPIDEEKIRLEVLKELLEGK
jgi:hypothetical protein